MPRLTAGPPDAKINGDGFRTYRWPVTNPDGSITEHELLSVTSIRKLVGEPWPLVAWQIGKVVDRAMTDDYRYRLAAARGAGDAPNANVIPAADIAALKKWLRAAATEDRDKAAAKGLGIHSAIELGFAPEDCDEETRPYVRQVRNFLADTGYRIVAQEQQVFNISVGFAGTLDVIFQRPDGTYCIGDWKTGKSITPDHALQLTAYLNGEFIGLHGKVDEEMTAILAQTTDAGILHLSPDGWSWYDLHKTDEEIVRAYFGFAWAARFLSAYPKADSLFTMTRRGKA